MPQTWQTWVQWDIDAWCGSASVQDMTDSEYRAYHNLLMAQFQSQDGMLPADEKELARISRKRSEWAAIREMVLEQFEPGGEGRLYNVRMFREWEKAREGYGKRRRAAEATNRVRSTNAARTQCVEKPDAVRAKTDAERSLITEQNNTEQNKNSSLRTARVRKPEPDALALVYSAYPRLVGKAKALHEIASAVERLCSGGTLPPMSEPEALQFLHERVVAFAKSPAGQQGEFTPHPSTWFHQERYFDDEQEWQRNGADRQQGQQRAHARTAAEQRHHDGLSEIASAFPEFAGRANDGAADGKREGELREPSRAAGMGRADAPTLDGDSREARFAGAAGRGDGPHGRVGFPTDPRRYQPASVSGTRASPLYAG